jgi:hypothetical protein
MMNIKEDVRIYLNRKEGLSIAEQKYDENNPLFDLFEEVHSKPYT